MIFTRVNQNLGNVVNGLSDEVEVNGNPEQDYRGVRVRKAWGAEYQLYANERVAVWHLTIKAGQRTSFHMHPNKKTGLIVLKGVAQVALGFSGGPKHMTPGDKVMIRPGCWHGTKALGCDLEVLEVETPPNKQDLVRLEDDYGRAGKPYEGPEALELFDSPKCPCKIGDCELFMLSWPSLWPPGCTVFLEGGVRDRLTGAWILSPGDVISSSTLAKLAAKFEALPSTVLEVMVAS